MHPETETRRFRAMNTDVLLAAQGFDPARLADGLERAQSMVCEGEARFSRFLEDSELSRLNRAAGQWFKISPEMLAVLQLAQSYYRATLGLFDPSILPDLRRAGYDRSMELLISQGSLPAARVEQNTPRPAFTEMQIDVSQCRALLPSGLTLDLGGIAKGWIAEQAAMTLAEDADACVVNAGGDMFMVGSPYGSARWPVALDDPREPGKRMAMLGVGAGGVATSAVTKRAWLQKTGQGEVQRHHLIDPRTGEPSTGEWLSVTVISAHAHLCEVFAKALLIAGPRAVERVQQAGTALFTYIAVDREGKLSGTHAIMETSYDY